MLYIYCLSLENNKYYIGKTKNPQYRLENHIKGKGSVWTRLYKPIKIIELIENCDDYDEDKYVRIYMDKYGIENVRGGSFSKINLSQNTVKQLENMSRGTNDKCFKCGKKGHFSTSCKTIKKNEVNFTSNKPIQVVNVISNIFDLAKDIYLISQTNNNDNNIKNNNIKNNNIKNNNIKNNNIKNNNIKNNNIKNNNIKNNNIKNNKKKYLKGNVNCYRCGRYGHYATKCKNKTHKDGHKLNS